MQKIKHAVWLTLFEIRHSILNYLLFLVVLLFFSFTLILTLHSYETSPSMGLDFQLLFILCFLPSLFRSKPFRSIHLHQYLYSSPFHILIKQLPIDDTTYITYHFIYRYFYSFVITNIFLWVLYPFWNIQISFMQYVVFVMIWVTISFTINMIDVYGQFGYHFFVWLAVIITIVPVCFFAYILLFYVYTYNDGFVFWTLQMAGQYTMYATICSFAIVLFNLFFWWKLLKRKLATVSFYV